MSELRDEGQKVFDVQQPLAARAPARPAHHFDHRLLHRFDFRAHAVNVSLAVPLANLGLLAYSASLAFDGQGNDVSPLSVVLKLQRQGKFFFCSQRFDVSHVHRHEGVGSEQIQARSWLPQVVQRHRPIAHLFKCAIDFRRTGDTNSTATIDYVTIEGTAKPGVDYVAASGTLAFAPGQTNRSLTVSILARQPPVKTQRCSLSRRLQIGRVSL